MFGEQKVVLWPYRISAIMVSHVSQQRRPIANMYRTVVGIHVCKHQ